MMITKSESVIKKTKKKTKNIQDIISLEADEQDWSKPT